jgi:hypothetical protein
MCTSQGTAKGQATLSTLFVDTQSVHPSCTSIHQDLCTSSSPSQGTAKGQAEQLSSLTSQLAELRDKADRDAREAARLEASLRKELVEAQEQVVAAQEQVCGGGERVGGVGGRSMVLLKSTGLKQEVVTCPAGDGTRTGCRCAGV